MTSHLPILVRYRWIAAFLFWQASAIIFIGHRFFSSLMGDTAVNWPSYIASMEALHLTWGLLTVPLFCWLHGKSFGSGSWFFISMAVALIHSVLTTALYTAVFAAVPGHLGYEQSEWLPRMQRMLITSPIISWVTTVVVLVGWYAGTMLVRYENERTYTSQLKSELTETQLQMLRMQLNPHFIFNAFNTISMMIRGGRTTEANDMVTKLSTLLRGSLSKQGNAYVTLEEEIKVCREYLEIEAIRFSDRLKIDITISPDLLMKKVPTLILQPLIENAFKHGLVNVLGSQALLSISTSKDTSGTWQIQVANTGQFRPDKRNEGLGLKNIQERMRLCYGASSSFTITQKENDTVMAQLTFPL